MSLASEFNAEMGANPLGDRESYRQAGRYVLEFYTRPFGWRRAVEAGEPSPSIVQAFVEDRDHWRRWKRVLYVRFPTEDDGREFFRNVQGTDSLPVLTGRLDDHYPGAAYDTGAL